MVGRIRTKLFDEHHRPVKEEIPSRKLFCFCFLLEEKERESGGVFKALKGFLLWLTLTVLIFLLFMVLACGLFAGRELMTKVAARIPQYRQKVGQKAGSGGSKKSGKSKSKKKK